MMTLCCSGVQMKLWSLFVSLMALSTAWYVRVKLNINQIRPLNQGDGDRNYKRITFSCTEKTVGFRLGSYKEGTIHVMSPDACNIIPQAMKDVVKVVHNHLNNHFTIRYKSAQHPLTPTSNIISVFVLLSMVLQTIQLARIGLFTILPLLFASLA